MAIEVLQSGICCIYPIDKIREYSDFVNKTTFIVFVSYSYHQYGDKEQIRYYD